MNKRDPICTYGFALTVVRHRKTGKYLCVEESKNRGYWLAGGRVEPGETFHQAAHRECLEEAGIKIELKGILRIEHSVCGDYNRLRVIYYAESDDDNPKSIPDEESVCAMWCDLQEIKALDKKKNGHRGEEIIIWPEYIQNGGLIIPLSFFTSESDMLTMTTLDHLKELNTFKGPLKGQY